MAAFPLLSYLTEERNMIFDNEQKWKLEYLTEEELELLEMIRNPSII